MEKRKRNWDAMIERILADAIMKLNNGNQAKKGWKMIIDRKIDIEMSLRQFMVQKWVVAYTHTHIYILEREIKSIELVCSTAIFIRFLATNVANVVLYYWMLINHSDICPIRMVQNKTGKKKLSRNFCVSKHIIC